MFSFRVERRRLANNEDRFKLQIMDISNFSVSFNPRPQNVNSLVIEGGNLNYVNKNLAKLFFIQHLGLRDFCCIKAVV